MKRRPYRASAGMSLIELLVGIAIGMIVVVAALISLAHTRTSASTLDASVAMHQNAALVWRTLGFQIRQAGAVPLVTSSAGANVEFRPTCLAHETECKNNPLAGDNGDSGKPDTLRVLFNVDASLTTSDCQGDEVATPQVTSEFHVVKGEFVCDDGLGDGALVAGVEDFQVSYLQHTGAQVQLVNLPASWNGITAVQVCLQLAGASRQELATDFINCAGQNVSPTDGRFHRVFRRVFNLRNAMP